MSEESKPASPNDEPPAFLVFDTETVPDGALIAAVKYPGEELTPEQAIERAQTEARDTSWNKSDFLPVSFHNPVAIAAVSVASDFSMTKLNCLDAPKYRTQEMVQTFWRGVEFHKRMRLVTFNGRGFDLPMLEMAAFRYGITITNYIEKARKRFYGTQIDLHAFLTNEGAVRLYGGLNLFAKIINKPGKMGIAGDQVYQLYREGNLQAINDYCLCDALDTYFVFLRTRVMTGDLSLDDEAKLILRARAFLDQKAMEFEVLKEYLKRWES